MHIDVRGLRACGHDQGFPIALDLRMHIDVRGIRACGHDQGFPIALDLRMHIDARGFRACGHDQGFPIALDLRMHIDARGIRASGHDQGFPTHLAQSSHCSLLFALLVSPASSASLHPPQAAFGFGALDLRVYIGRSGTYNMHLKESMAWKLEPRQAGIPA